MEQVYSYRNRKYGPVCMKRTSTRNKKSLNARSSLASGNIETMKYQKYAFKYLKTAKIRNLKKQTAAQCVWRHRRKIGGWDKETRAKRHFWDIHMTTTLWYRPCSIICDALPVCSITLSASHVDQFGIAISSHIKYQFPIIDRAPFCPLRGKTGWEPRWHLEPKKMSY